MKHHTLRPIKRSFSLLFLLAACGQSWAQAAPAAPAMPTAEKAAAPAASTVNSERWYVLQLNGDKAGSLRETVTTTPEGHRATDQHIVFSLSRAGTKMEISMKTGFVETADGKPVSMSLDQNLGLVHIQTDYTFTDEGVVEETRQGEVKRRSVNPKIEGEWLTPSGVEKLVQSNLKSGEKSFTFRSVSPTTGVQAFDTSVTVLEPGAQAEAMGMVVPATKWETEMSVMPGTKNTEWVDDSGRPVRSEVEIAGMKLLMLLSDKEVALSPFTAPEAMAQTAIVPTGNFTVPARATKDAIYTVSRDDNRPIENWPLGGFQRTTLQQDGTYIVKVDVSWPVAMWPLKESEKFLAPTTVCNTQDPEIVAFANKAIEGTGDNKFERAKILRLAVNEHIQKKNLGVGFASASEVVRSKQGDCTEHAVLLAAALRAVNIPSRVVSGIIYTEEFEGMRNVFVYHMWTQAFVQRGNENNWIDLDATLPGERYFDSAHIALSVSDLSNTETFNTMVGLSEVIGKLRVNVELVE